MKEEQKSVIPELSLFDSHEVVKRVDNDAEVEITTFANLTPLDWKRLVKAGWVQRAANVAAYIKVRYSKEDFNPVQFSEAVENAGGFRKVSKDPSLLNTKIDFKEVEE